MVKRCRCGEVLREDDRSHLCEPIEPPILNRTNKMLTVRIGHEKATHLKEYGGVKTLCGVELIKFPVVAIINEDATCRSCIVNYKNLRR